MKFPGADKTRIVCLSCSDSPLEGRSRCRSCLNRSAESAARYRTNHPERIKDSSQRDRINLLAEGLCISCRRFPSLPKRTRCADCLKKHRDQIERKRASRREKGVCRQCGSYSGSRAHCRNCLDLINIRDRALRNEVLIAYGNKCTCCGESERSFLQIDHKVGKGRSDRLAGLYSARWYRWLKNHDFPADYQLLCANCNWGKHLNGGICPHQNLNFEKESQP